LAEFDPPAGDASSGWSGVDIRLFLEPLTSPAVQTDPNEFVDEDYVSNAGLGGASEDAILDLIKELPAEPQAAVENSLRDSMSENIGLEGVSRESAELQNAKAQLAQLRTHFTETNLQVQQALARVKALESK
jgi:succinate dehydrogenase/fumarate reductase flavoprotein subunit